MTDARERKLREMVIDCAEAYDIDHNGTETSPSPDKFSLSWLANEAFKLGQEAAPAQGSAEPAMMERPMLPPEIRRLQQAAYEGFERGVQALKDHMAVCPGPPLLIKKEDLCGSALAAILTKEDGHHIVNPADDFAGVLLPDEEWKHLSQESRNKLKKWHDLAVERLQLILDEDAPPSVPQASPEPTRCPSCNLSSRQEANCSSEPLCSDPWHGAGQASAPEGEKR